MRQVVIIGGGVAGLEAAGFLGKMGHQVVLLEKEKAVGGHVGKWDRLFPNRRQGSEVMDFIRKKMDEKVSIITEAGIKSIDTSPDGYAVVLTNGEAIRADAILLATGFELFDARKKEEYGYGIYDNVITSADLERIFREEGKITTADGQAPQKVAFVHCVGSRDEKAGNVYCSKVCCVTGVKQAIEVKEMMPAAKVYSFYMDIRMFDRHFEELYIEAQQQGITFIRGRLSEVYEDQGKVQCKVEDTLTGKPMKVTVDLLVLLVGFMPSPETKRLAGMLKINIGSDGFVLPIDGHISQNETGVPGIFLAGAVTGPKCIATTLSDARSAALQIDQYLKTK
ncbi:MAG: CoB--CoM heterodisulfide reductase iron-sulfur subunit A family protein [Bacteroidetes bacterium]|nr:CoB--CoM heterodisulfide reductase iron-sulfur subunit A family protein [Bacteroidota bacterium]